MKYYQEKGYFSAIAVVNSQDFQTGELVIEVREGGRNSITIQE
jgi:hemolysin activation/secretion protein